MSRPPKDSELECGIAYLAFAEDKVVVVTSSELPITGLTSKQVKDIFLGAITNWSEVGGPDALIVVIVREEKDSNTKILRDGLFGDGTFAAGSVVLGSEGETKTALSGGTNSIGYLAYSGVRLEDLPVHALALDGQDPAVVGGSYPLDMRTLGVAYLPGNSEKVQPFLDFITSPQAHERLAGQGIEPIK